MENKVIRQAIDIVREDRSGSCEFCSAWDNQNGCTQQGCNSQYSNSVELICNKLESLTDKIENGTLVELPCKVGDKVFDITDRPEIWEVEVKGFLIDEKGIWFNFGLYQKRVGLLGIKIFLTKAEAEKRLEELRGEV